MELTPASSRVRSTSGVSVSTDFSQDVTMLDALNLVQSAPTMVQNVAEGVELFMNEPFFPGPLRHVGLKRQRSGSMSFNWPSKRRKTNGSGSGNAYLMWLVYPKKK